MIVSYMYGLCTVFPSFVWGIFLSDAHRENYTCLKKIGGAEGGRP